MSYFLLTIVVVSEISNSTKPQINKSCPVMQIMLHLHTLTKLY